jgi:hypothetical protein
LGSVSCWLFAEKLFRDPSTLFLMAATYPKIEKGPSLGYNDQGQGGFHAVRGNQSGVPHSASCSRGLRYEVIPSHEPGLMERHLSSPGWTASPTT